MKKITLIFLLMFQVHLFGSSILILNSYHKGYEWSDHVIEGMEDLFYKRKDIDVNILYMDSKRVTSKQYYDSLEKLYEIQLKNREYDLVIALDRFAYDFILKVKNNLFKDIPILAVGIENFSKEKAKKFNVSNRVSALLEKRDLQGNVDLIKNVFPKIKKLYIINDISENALHTEPLIKDLIKQTSKEMDVVYLKENDLDSLRKRFSKWEQNSVGLFIRYYKNRDGRLNKNDKIAEFIKNAKIPIFVTDSLFIKKGATGGRVIDLVEFGKTSANMAFDILDGKGNKVVVSNDLYRVFDSEKLKEFVISLQNVTRPYILVNKEQTYFEKHRGFINFVFTISPFLLFLILGLVHNIYMRKQVEKDLRRRIEFDATLLDAIDSPIFWEDYEGKIVDSNKTFCKLLHIKCEDLYGKKLEDFKDNSYVSKIIDIIEKYKQNRNENNEFEYIDEDSKEKIYLLKQEKFKDEKTNSEGFVTIFTDITIDRETDSPRKTKK